MIREINGSIYVIKKHNGKQISQPLAAAETETAAELSESEHNLRSLVERVKTAERLVARAVVDGTDSTTARAGLADAQQSLATAMAESDAIRQRLTDYQLARINQRANQLDQEQQHRMSEFMNRFTLELSA